MGINYSPKIATEGLVFYIDFSNMKCQSGRSSLLIDWNVWQNGGTGTVTPFYQNGDGNSRVIDTNPWGYQDVVWDVSDQDVDSNADGGFNRTAIDIDNTKMYRFSIWMRRKTVGTGSSYLGIGPTWNADQQVVYRSNGTATQNPYFHASGWSTKGANTWYLIVGHVWPKNSGTGDNHPDSGIWRYDGVKAGNVNEFVWTDSTINTYIRSYLYYSTDITTNQQFYRPRIDICDGTQPSLQDLLNDCENRNKDLTRYKGIAYPFNNPGFTKENSKLAYYTFTQSQTHYMKVERPDLNGGSFAYSTVTFNMWIRPPSGDNGTSSTNNNLISVENSFEVSIGDNGDGTSGLMYASNPWAWYGVEGVLTNDVWNMVTFVHDITGRWLFVNGQQVYYRDDTGGIGAGTDSYPYMTLMGRYDGESANASGDVASVSLYGRSLNSQEVLALFNSQRKRFGI